MTERSTEVPEEMGKTVLTDLSLQALAEHVLPALRKQGADQERQRIREALKQPIHDLATHIGRARMEIEDLYEPPAVAAAASELKAVVTAMADLRAALLDTLDPSREDCKTCGGSGKGGFRKGRERYDCPDCNGTGKKPVSDTSGEQGEN